MVKHTSKKNHGTKGTRGTRGTTSNNNKRTITCNTPRHLFGVSEQNSFRAEHRRRVLRGNAETFTAVPRRKKKKNDYSFFYISYFIQKQKTSKLPTSMSKGSE